MEIAAAVQGHPRLLHHQPLLRRQRLLRHQHQMHHQSTQGAVHPLTLLQQRQQTIRILASGVAVAAESLATSSKC
jgi:hypothetical protein